MIQGATATADCNSERVQMFPDGKRRCQGPGLRKVNDCILGSYQGVNGAQMEPILHHDLG